MHLLLSNPEKIPKEKYWLYLGITKDQKEKKEKKNQTTARNNKERNLF